MDGSCETPVWRAADRGVHLSSGLLARGAGTVPVVGVVHYFRGLSRRRAKPAAECQRLALLVERSGTVFAHLGRPGAGRRVRRKPRYIASAAAVGAVIEQRG